MSTDLYIWITRWESFQHYKPERDRCPAWIKSYTKQMDDERYLRLTDRQRALLRDLRDVFAIAHGRLSYDTRMITRRRNSQTRDVDLRALNHAGLIEFVSRPTLEQRLEEFYSKSSPRARPRARREGEVEREEENPNPEGSTVSSNPSVRTAEANYDARNGTDGIDYVDKREPRDPDDYGPPGIDYANILRGIGE